MNLKYNLKIIGIGVILIFLICIGLHFYLQWDIQRFANNLEDGLAFDVSTKPASQKNIMMQKRNSQTTSSGTVELKGLSSSPIVTEKVDVEIGEFPIVETQIPVSNIELDVPKLSTTTVELPPALAAESIESVNSAKTAFRDYNDLLRYDPEKAYTRLADGLREELGDHPDVDIFVENVKRANNRTLTVDNAITMVNAIISLMPENEYETINQLSDNIITLEAIKTLQEEGEVIGIEFNFKF